MQIKVKNSAFIELTKIKDGRDGILCVAEQKKEIPFEIKRVFYIFDLHDNKAIRGKHAHRKTEQAIFCINGSFEIHLDDGENKQKIKLDKPNEGLYLGTMLWNVMTKFSDDCMLLVFASDLYDESDYIRNYEEFKNEAYTKTKMINN